MTQAPQQMASSDFNLEKLDTRKLEKHIFATIEAESNIAIFGRRGTGKTQISEQQIQAADHHEVYMNLSVFERVDLGGYPDMFTPAEKKEKFVNYILPRMYEPMINGNKPVVALLDEVDKADQSLWAPLLEFVNKKSINGRPLPNLKSVIMTGNLISEGGLRPSLPLLDRTEGYMVEANANCWLEWAALSNEIHPSIYQYIYDHITQLLGPVDAGENYKDPSPRGWHLASRVLFIGERKGWNLNLLNEKVCGFVGKKAGLDYKIYYTNYKVLLPIVDMVFNGGNYKEDWKKLTPTEKLYAATIICSRFAAELDATTPANPPASIKSVGNFMQFCGYENVLASVRSQLKVPRIIRYSLDEHEAWEGILTKVHSQVNY